MFSIKPEFGPSWEKEPQGSLKGQLTIKYPEPEAWGLTTIFRGKYVEPGIYKIPLFKKAPDLFNLKALKVNTFHTNAQANLQHI